jgi:PII-like signaling protein
VNEDCLKLTTYFGERHRTEHGLVADALLDVYGRHEVAVSVLLRGALGFGLEHHLRTDRLLTLSEDLPLVAVAVDERPPIEALLPQATELLGGGLITLERARLLHDGLGVVELPEELHEATKLTIYLGRDERVGGRPAFAAAVDHLHERGLAGATVLLGVDGMAHRRRRRARFFSRNEAVPAMIVSVGSGRAIAEALPGLEAMLDDPIVTLERVRVCKRDGNLLAEPVHLPEQDDAGLGIWQRLMVYAGEQSRHAGHPLHLQLVRRLREEGASGATSLRGVWGFSGDHAPHGDRFLSVRRHVPVLTSIVDRPDAIRRWFRVVDECTSEAGLVTSETVPALHAVAPGRRIGRTRLARLRH